ncbi:MULTISPECIES: hypothetical protein [unclassified Nonomuraea]|uniref:hypothetical protein n=1 Tax=unclassified Nonomuraea TaxID=2593643 RepID=UPI00340A38ED
MTIRVAVPLAGEPVLVAESVRFARRQRLTLTPFNAAGVARRLRADQRFRYAGAGAGAALGLAGMVQEYFPASPYYPVIGWFAGVIAAEIAGSRSVPRRVRPAGMRPAPRALVGIWRAAAVLSCGIALSTVARSFRMEVGVAERLGATLALASVLAVHLLVRDLRRRVLPAGPVDLVAAELALRARSARVVSRAELPGVLATTAVPSPAGDTLATVATESSPGGPVPRGVVLTDARGEGPTRTVVPRLPAGWRARAILRWESGNTLVTETRGPHGEVGRHLLNPADGTTTPLRLDDPSPIVVGTLQQQRS